MAQGDIWRTQFSKHVELAPAPDGRRRFTLDASVDPMHYMDGVGAWQDIDADFEESDGGAFTAKFTKLPYLVRMGNDSFRRIYPDRNDLSYWIELGKPFPNMGAPTKVKGYWVWNFPNAIIAVHVQTSAVKLAFRLENANAPTSITIPFNTQGITRTGRTLYHNGQPIALLRKPVAEDSSPDPITRDLNVVFNPGSVTLSLDTTGMTFPIDIDPTIDAQVGAGADDGFIRRDESLFVDTDTSTFVGSIHASILRLCDGWSRFTGISGLAGATIDVAYYSVRGVSVQSGSPETKVYAEAAAAPAAPTSAANYNAKTPTTAGVDWDGLINVGSFNNSPSIIPVIDEIKSLDPSVIQILHKDDTGVVGTNWQRASTYEHNTSYAPKLHIEYTPGGQPYISRVQRVAGMRTWGGNG